MRYTVDKLHAAFDWARTSADETQLLAVDGKQPAASCRGALWCAGDELAGKVIARSNVVLIDNPAASLRALACYGFGALYGQTVAGLKPTTYDQMRNALCDGIYAPKNTDYGDAFAVCGVPGICVRLLDKHLRVANLTNRRGLGELREALVLDESIYDTLRDMSVYAGMGIMLLREGSGE